jgi:hypothetical protein
VPGLKWSRPGCLITVVRRWKPAWRVWIVTRWSILFFPLKSEDVQIIIWNCKRAGYLYRTNNCCLYQVRKPMTLNFSLNCKNWIVNLQNLLIWFIHHCTKVKRSSILFVRPPQFGSATCEKCVLARLNVGSSWGRRQAGGCGTRDQGPSNDSSHNSIRTPSDVSASDGAGSRMTCTCSVATVFSLLFFTVCVCVCSVATVFSLLFCRYCFLHTHTHTYTQMVIVWLLVKVPRILRKINLFLFRIPRVACRLRQQVSIYLLYWYKSTNTDARLV